MYLFQGNLFTSIKTFWFTRLFSFLILSECQRPGCRVMEIGSKEYECPNAEHLGVAGELLGGRECSCFEAGLDWAKATASRLHLA